MNKILAIIIIVLLVAGGAAILFLGAKKEPVNTSTQEIEQPQVLNSLLTVINNNVETKLAQEAEFKIVQEAAEVSEGSTIKTATTGRAIIENEDATITVDKNSEITLHTQQKNKGKIQLGAGNLWARVQKVFGQGEYFQVQTPNAVATVRGTAFSVLYADGQTIVWVHEGSVAIFSKDPATDQQIGDELTIEAAQKATIASGYEPVLQDVSAADKKHEWYLFNLEKARNETAPTTGTQPKPPAGTGSESGNTAQEPIVCTQDVKQCPDGSYVGRVAPACEFKACPATQDPYKR